MKWLGVLLVGSGLRMSGMGRPPVIFSSEVAADNLMWMVAQCANLQTMPRDLLTPCTSPCPDYLNVYAARDNQKSDDDSAEIELSIFSLLATSGAKVTL
jgi:hypothetical protein